MFFKLVKEELRKQDWNEEKQLLKKPLCDISNVPFVNVILLIEHNSFLIFQTFPLLM
jgi:hypothetical protein